jgi:hypothetical protein
MKDLRNDGLARMEPKDCGPALSQAVSIRNLNDVFPVRRGEKRTKIGVPDLLCRRLCL